MSYVEAGENFLEHYGAKGMKWGVRKDKGNTGKSYKNWKKEATSKETASSVTNATLKSMKSQMDKLNNDPRFKGKDLTKDKKLSREYDRETMGRFNAEMARHSISQTATKAKGGRAVLYQMDNSGYIRAREMKLVKHADTDQTVILLPGETPPAFQVVRDDKGFIIDIKVVDESSVSQSNVDFGETFLQHYGKKGMRWGVRKKTGSAASGKTDGRANNKPPQNPHQKRQAEAAGKDVKRGKDKTLYKKAPNRLSESELKARINRMELEKKYNELNAEPPSARKKAVDDIIQNSGKQIATTVLVGAGLLATKKIIEKKFGEDVASAVTGKGKKK